METEETVNLAALGVRFSAPGFSLPTVVGPFNYMDLRARLTQTVADFTSQVHAHGWFPVLSLPDISRARMRFRGAFQHQWPQATECVLRGATTRNLRLRASAVCCVRSAGLARILVLSGR